MGLPRSDDAGDSFADPVELDSGAEVQGRIAVALDDTQAWAVWLRDDGSVVSCTEKVKVMNENLDELQQMAQDLFEDALLMEVSETQIREVLHGLVGKLVNPYGKL